MYKAVIGLEVHCELDTKTKNFSGALNDTSSMANENVATVDLGLPGILPVVNENAIHSAIKIALALNCKVPKEMTFERKNYFYPDLPKGYQITQLDNPVGVDGYLNVHMDDGDIKVLIHDTHLEEDTASLEHHSNYSLINYNRCGVPLLETVTEPCLHSSKEAIAFLESLRNIFLYTGISKARADLGQIRCDVNVSLMEEGSTKLGTRVEMKNINSFINVKEAIECEIKRQTEILENGGVIEQETRRFDTTELKTYPMRSKEDAIDYRYFKEPNIPPVIITEELISELKEEIPMLQYERVNHYVDLGLTKHDASILAKEKDISDYFEECLSYKVDAKSVSNWITGSILGYINKNELNINDIFVKPSMLVDIINLVKEGTISSKQAKEVLNKALEEHKEPSKIVEDEGMKQIGDSSLIMDVINEVLDEKPESIEQYKNGRTNILDFLVGQVMKKTRGQANPAMARSMMLEEIERR